MKKNRNLGRLLGIAMAISLSTPAMAQAPVDDDSEIASEADLSEARGGYVWFYYVAVTATTAVLRTCSRFDCARAGAAVFSSAAAARRYICQRNRRLRIC